MITDMCIFKKKKKKKHAIPLKFKLIGELVYTINQNKVLFHCKHNYNNNKYFRNKLLVRKVTACAWTTLVIKA